MAGTAGTCSTIWRAYSVTQNSAEMYRSILFSHIWWGGTALSTPYPQMPSTSKSWLRHWVRIYYTYCSSVHQTCRHNHCLHHRSIVLEYTGLC